MHALTENHWSAVKWILRYLHGTVEHGMLIRRSSSFTLQAFTDVLCKGNLDTSLEAFSDADWAGDSDDRRSTGGFAIYLEAEYKALADTVAELTWLQALLNELGVSSSSTPIIWCDNLGATYLSANPIFHARTKHVKIDYHFIRENVAQGDLRVQHISTQDQIADIFTKPLPIPRFFFLRSKLQNYSRKVVGDPKFPCYFIFGDSLLDVGNNNALKTGAKANYLPYGIDFPQGPTGRFSNGLNTADFVAYATVKRQDVLKGVNYASAVSGILDESGEIVWLYKLGARKLCISGSGQIGCVPAEKRLFGPRIACVKEINDALNIFNAKILSLHVDLNINLEDAKLVYHDHDINNPISGLPQFDGMWRETLLTTRSVLVVKFQLKVLREGNVFRPM
ncbi:hypothetical protein Tco_0468582 [Tanacetum coccineum]